MVTEVTAFDGAHEGQIDGWTDFADRMCAAVVWACAQPSDLLFSDHDFMSWPLGQMAVNAALQQWAVSHPRKSATWLLSDPTSMIARYPRWWMWRQRWAHRMSIFQADESHLDQVPTLLLMGQSLGLKVHDRKFGRGIWTCDPSTLRAWRDDVDVILQRSHHSLPVTTLGL